MKTLLIFSLLLIVVGLRVLAQLSSIHVDEAYSYVFYGSQNWLTALGMYNLPNNHFLNTFFIKLFATFFGPGVFSLRLGVFLFGLALAVPVFLFWNKLFGFATGLMASFLTTSYFGIVEYSSLARGYIYQVFFFWMALYLALKIQQSSTTRLWTIFSFCLLLSVYAVPTGIYAIGIPIMFLLFQNLNPINLKQGFKILALVIGLGGSILFFPPLIYHLIWGTTVRELGANTQKWTAILENLNALWVSFMDTTALPSRLTIFVVGLFGILKLIKINFSVHPQFENSKTLFQWILFFAVWPVFIILALQVVPAFSRVWLFLCPLFCGLTAWTLTDLVDIIFKTTGKMNTIKKAVLVLISGLVIFDTSYSVYKNISRPQNSQSIYASLNGLVKPDSIVACTTDFLIQLKFFQMIHGQVFDYVVRDPSVDFKIVQFITPDTVSPDPKPGTKTIVIAFSPEHVQRVLKYLAPFYAAGYPFKISVIKDFSSPQGFAQIVEISD